MGSTDLEHRFTAAIRFSSYFCNLFVSNLAAMAADVQRYEYTSDDGNELMALAMAAMCELATKLTLELICTRSLSPSVHLAKLSNCSTAAPLPSELLPGTSVTEAPSYCFW